jgi:hypothetical protein
MRLKTLLFAHPQSRSESLYPILSRELLRMLRKSGMPESPLTMLCVEDLASSCEAVRMAEEILMSAGEAQDAAAFVRLLDAVGKARERMRKAMKEMRDLCAQYGKPAGRTLPEGVMALIESGKGVIEQSLDSDESDGEEE